MLFKKLANGLIEVVGLSGAYSTRTLDSSARINIRSNGTFDIFEDSKTSLTFEFSTSIGTLIDPATDPTTYATASELYEALRDDFFFELASGAIPEVTEAERLALPTSNGLLVYQTNNDSFLPGYWYYDDYEGSWQRLINTQNLDDAVFGAIRIVGNVNASVNPNYPNANAIGWAYRITASGRIGGAAGKVVKTGDIVVGININAGGTEAAVGANWTVLSSANILGGTLANRPTTPALYQMYFATDQNTNGIPIWWNGTNWVNASGAIIV